MSQAGQAPGPSQLQALSEADIDGLLQSDDFRMYGYKVICICRLTEMAVFRSCCRHATAACTSLRAYRLPACTLPCRSCRARGGMRTIGHRAPSTMPARKPRDAALEPSPTLQSPVPT